VAGEIQEIFVGTDGKGWAAAAQGCESGQGRANCNVWEKSRGRVLGTFQVFCF